MYTQVTEQSFIDAFISIRPDNFSRDGLLALFNFFEQLEDDTGEPMELDVIAICCEFSELTLEEVRYQYSNELEQYMPLDDDELIDVLSDNTLVIPVDDGTIIIQDF